MKQKRNRIFALLLVCAILVIGVNYTPVQEEAQAIATHSAKRYYEDGQYNTVDWTDKDTYIQTVFHECDSLTETYMGEERASVTLGGLNYDRYKISGVDTGTKQDVASVRFDITEKSTFDLQCHFYNADGINMEDYDYFEFYMCTPTTFTYDGTEVVFQTNHKNLQPDEYLLEETDGNGFSVAKNNYDKNGNKVAGQPFFMDISEHTYTYNANDYNANDAPPQYNTVFTPKPGDGRFFRFRIDISDYQKGVVNRIVIRFINFKDTNTTGTSRFYIDRLSFTKPSQHQALRYSNDYLFSDEDGIDYDSYNNGDDASAHIATAGKTSAVQVDYTNELKAQVSGEGAVFYGTDGGSIKVWCKSVQSNVSESVIIGHDLTPGTDHTQDDKYKFKAGELYDCLRFRLRTDDNYVKTYTSSVLTVTFGNYTNAAGTAVSNLWTGKFYIDLNQSRKWQEVTVELPSNIASIIKTESGSDGFQAVSLNFDSLYYGTFGTIDITSNRYGGGFYLDNFEFIRQQTPRVDEYGEVGQYPAGKYLMVNDFDTLEGVRTDSKVYGAKLYQTLRREDVLAKQTAYYAGSQYNEGGFINRTTYADENESPTADGLDGSIYVPGVNYDERHMVTQGTGATLVRSDGDYDFGNTPAYTEGSLPTNKDLLGMMYYRQLVNDPTTQSIDLTDYMYLSMDIFIRAVDTNYMGVQDNSSGRYISFKISLVSDRTNTVENGKENGKGAESGVELTVRIPVGADNYCTGSFQLGNYDSVPVAYELVPLRGFRAGAGDSNGQARTGYTPWGAYRLIFNMQTLLEGCKRTVDGADNYYLVNILEKITKMRIVWNNGEVNYTNATVANHQTISDEALGVNETRQVDFVFDNLFAFTPDMDLTITANGNEEDFALDTNTQDEPPTFLYRIQGTDDATDEVDMVVAIPAGGSVTLRNLPANGYSITPLTENWRYTLGNNTITEHVSMLNDTDRDPEVYMAGLSTVPSGYAHGGRYFSSVTVTGVNITGLNRTQSIDLGLTRTNQYWLDGQDAMPNQFASP